MKRTSKWFPKKQSAARSSCLRSVSRAIAKRARALRSKLRLARYGKNKVKVADPVELKRPRTRSMIWQAQVPIEGRITRKRSNNWTSKGSTEGAVAVRVGGNPSEENASLSTTESNEKSKKKKPNEKADDSTPLTEPIQASEPGEHAEEPSGEADCEYEVEEILDYSPETVDLYLIKWKGFDSTQNRWEPIQNLFCKEILENFYLSQVEAYKQASHQWLKSSGQRNFPLLNRVYVPPDPRTFPEQVKYFFEKLARSVSETELKNYGNKLKEWVRRRWPQGRILRYIRRAHIRKLRYNDLQGLRIELIYILAERKNDLREWEAKLNGVTNGLPQISVENDVDFTKPPMDFLYVNGYVHHKDVVVKGDLPPACSCRKYCSKDNVQCSVSHGMNGPAYNKDKRLRLSYLAGGVRDIYECSKHCKCGPDCCNRVVQEGLVSLRGTHLCIFRTPNGKGWGVKTMQPIKKGSFVCMYTGEVIKEEEAERRGLLYDQRGQTYLFDLVAQNQDEQTFVIDAISMGNVSHFMNHACSPNLVVFNVYADVIDINIPKLAIFATKDIPAQAELTYDYVVDPAKRYIHESNAEFETECLCETENCRGYIF